MEKNEKISYADDEVINQKPSVSKYLKYLLFFGPGAVLASMTIGQGQLIIGPQIGAWAGYGLIWLITINVASYIFCYLGTRFTVLTGLSLMDIVAFKSKGGWFNWLIVVIMLVFIPVFTATIITTTGQSLAWIFFGSSQLGVYLPLGIGACLLVVFLIFFFKYSFLENVQAFFVVVLAIGSIISAVMALSSVANFDVISFLSGYFNFGNIPSYPDWVITNFPDTTTTSESLLTLGMLGTLTISIIPLVGYLSWAKVKRWGIFHDVKDPAQFEEERFQDFKKSNTITYLPEDQHQVKKAKKLLKPLQIDLTIAFVIVAIVSSCYLICGHLLLGPQPDGSYIFPAGMDLIEAQAVIFTSLASWLLPLYQISVFFAFFGTMYAGFEAASRMLHETTKHIVPRIGAMEYRKFMAYLVLYILVLGIPISLLIYKGLSFLLVLSITLLFIGVVCVAIWGGAVIYLSQKMLPKPYRLKTIGVVIAIIALLMFISPFFAMLL